MQSLQTQLLFSGRVHLIFLSQKPVEQPVESLFFYKLSSIKRALIKFGFNVICVFTSVDSSRKRGVVFAGYVLRVHVVATESLAKRGNWTINWMMLAWIPKLMSTGAAPIALDTQRSQVFRIPCWFCWSVLANVQRYRVMSVRNCDLGAGSFFFAVKGARFKSRPEQRHVTKTLLPEFSTNGVAQVAFSKNLETPLFHALALHIREFSQIENVAVDVNVDVESHPVGHNPPQILVFFSMF